MGIVLKRERIGYVIEKFMLSPATATASPEEIETYETHKSENDIAPCMKTLWF